MKKFAVLALAFAVSNAFAANCGNDKDVGNADCDKPGSVNPVTVSPTISPTISNEVYWSNTSTGGQGGSANANGGSATSSSGATAGATANNSQSITFTSPERATIKSTGDAPSVIGSATAPCRVAVGASAGWLGGAFGIGTSVMDESCNLREVSRHLWNLGLKTEAIKVMCQDETAKAVMGNFCQ